MQKFSQKAATKDPELVELKQFKSDWNQKSKDFISNLIAFKKLINGKNNKYYTYPEKANLKNVIPADPAKILVDLTSQFEYLASNGNKFIQKQKSFSEHVKERKVKKANIEYNIRVEASNILTRFFSRLKEVNPFSSEDFFQFENDKRLSLLNKYAELERSLIHFKKKLLASSEPEIKESDSEKLNRSLSVIDQNKKQKSYALNDDIKHINGILTSISVLLKDYLEKKKNMFEDLDSSDSELYENSKNIYKYEKMLDPNKIQKIEDIIEDIESNKDLLLNKIPNYSKTSLEKLISLIYEDLALSESPSDKNKFMDRIIRVYDQILNKLNSKLNKNYTSFSDFIDEIDMLKDDLSEVKMPELNTTAAIEDPLTKIREFINKINVLSPTAPEKKSIIQSINAMKKNIQETMNSLENFFDEEQISNSLDELFTELKSINYNLTSIGLSSSYIDSSYDRYHDKFNYFGRSSRIHSLPKEEQSEVFKKLKQKLLNRGL